MRQTRHSEAPSSLLSSWDFEGLAEFAPPVAPFRGTDSDVPTAARLASISKDWLLSESVEVFAGEALVPLRH